MLSVLCYIDIRCQTRTFRNIKGESLKDKVNGFQTNHKD
jgi:hypothetical protein